MRFAFSCLFVCFRGLLPAFFFHACFNRHRADLVFGDFSDGVQGADGDVVDILGAREMEVCEDDAGRDPVGDDGAGDHLAAPGAKPHRLAAV